ncbi:hypothetical protein GLW08_15005 [Pontibacillus yanchengensis]|uniref:Uncharacterized protein n=1 Tax=Pontibacillus yanchengensis TaxID=462910 RepID=A0ACC7VIM7_9BACI|nr:EcsC family protein [Pontibacillus yanchengensis]MYL54642.1 hypothetical protein [Pontibacillus yanchengensis]
MSIDNSFLDLKERQLLETLTTKYEEFIEPSSFQKQISRTTDKASELLPEKVKKMSSNAIKNASDWTVIRKVIESAGEGFGVVNENSARYTLSKKNLLNSLNNEDNEINEFTRICELRSYYIEKNLLNRRRLLDLPTAFVGGGITGFFGLLGVPFNLAYTFFMYYRTVQTVALFYGYDVVDDPRELEFASSVTITCLSPHITSDVQNLGSIVSRMMFATNVTVLKESLSKLSYEQMAQKGGAELLYVQIRALANAQAKKALEKAGKEGVEAGIFKKLLEQIGKRMTKEGGKKIVPVIGGVVGAFSDTYTMNKIIHGANLIYHKRFLFEKDIRINELNFNSDLNRNSDILDYDEIMKKFRS